MEISGRSMKRQYFLYLLWPPGIFPGDFRFGHVGSKAYLGRFRFRQTGQTGVGFLPLRGGGGGGGILITFTFLVVSHRHWKNGQKS